MTDGLKKFLRVFVFFATGIVILYFVFKNYEAKYLEDCALKGISEEDCNLVDKLISDFLNSNLWIVFGSVVVFMLSNLLRALRWNQLFDSMGKSVKLANSLGAIMIGYLANLAFPRAGEVVRAGVIASYEEEVSAEEAFGTIILDRVIDVICLGIVAVLTLVFAYDTIYDYLNQLLDLESKWTSLLSNLPLLIAIALGGIALLYAGYKNLDRLSSTKFGSKIVNLINGLKDGLLSIFKLENPWLFVGYSVAIWLCYYAMTYMVFFAFAPTSHLSAIAGLVVFFFGSLGIVVPSPGGLGTYHYLVSESLHMYDVPLADGLSFANIVYVSIQIFGNIFFGFAAYILLPLVNRKPKKESDG